MNFVHAASALLLAAGPAPAPTPTVSGPYTHDNLQIFLMHGPDRVKDAKWLTLEEAMRAKKVRVIETQEVNELAIENLGTETVFVEAGEIVKGGQQDRVVAVDLVVRPKSGKLPIASFCVESGRWEQRGNEKTTEFSGSSANVASKSLTLAARKDGDQSQVWKEVSATQEKLASNLSTDVRAKESASSLQLTLENEKLRETRKAYVDALTKAIDGKSDVVGFAVAINGHVTSADVYASGVLFRKLWKKKLDAAATEAVAELGDRKADWKPATADDLKAVLADAETGKSTVKPIGAKSRLRTSESDKNILFETDDVDGWVKRSYLVK